MNRTSGSTYYLAQPDPQETVHHSLNRISNHASSEHGSLSLEEFSIQIESLFESCHLNHISREKIINFFSQHQIPGQLSSYKKIESYCDKLISIGVKDYFYNKVMDTLDPLNEENKSSKSYAGKLKILSFIDNLRFLVKRNYEQIRSSNEEIKRFFSNYSEHPSRTSRSFVESKHYYELWRESFEDVSSHVLRITLLINIDDARMINSRSFAATPMSASIAELSPSCRNKRDNILLLAFYWGTQKINYQVLCKKVLLETFEDCEIDRKPFLLNINDTLIIPVMVKVGLMVLDAPARSSFLCNMQWNSTYGCATCTYKANSIEYIENSVTKKRCASHMKVV